MIIVTPTRPVDNVVIATKGLQDRNINIIAGTTVENKGKLIQRRQLKWYGHLLKMEDSRWPKDIYQWAR